jgi:hypothetical protein
MKSKGLLGGDKGRKSDSVTNLRNRAPQNEPSRPPQESRRIQIRGGRLCISALYSPCTGGINFLPELVLDLWVKGWAVQYPRDWFRSCFMACYHQGSLYFSDFNAVQRNLSLTPEVHHSIIYCRKSLIGLQVQTERSVKHSLDNTHRAD